MQLGNGRFDGTGGGLSQTANRGVPHDLGDLGTQGQLIRTRAQWVAADQSMQQFFLTHCPNATGDALPTRLIPEEGGDARQHCFHLNGIIEHHDGTRADGGTDGARALECQRRVELRRGEKCASRSTQ